MNNKLLEVKDLSICYRIRKGVVKAVNNISFSIKEGETLGIVGETGAGKTTTALGIMNLIPRPPGEITHGEIFLNNQDLLKLDSKDMRKIRGKEISMIFQDPMTALNPLMKVGDQITEVVKLHDYQEGIDLVERSKEMLEIVGISRDRFEEYPHQFSGGMKQRVIIAIALACNPKLIISDEPTTALDVTIQAQVLHLMKGLKQKFNTSMIFISHDLGVISDICDKVAIMYSGEIIESGTIEDIINNGSHPYTIGLFQSIPDINDEKARLTPIKGLMPDPISLPFGCKFADRCPVKSIECEQQEIELVNISDSHSVRCIRFY